MPASASRPLRHGPRRGNRDASEQVDAEHKAWTTNSRAFTRRQPIATSRRATNVRSSRSSSGLAAGASARTPITGARSSRSTHRSAGSPLRSGSACGSWPWAGRCPRRRRPRSSAQSVRGARSYAVPPIHFGRAAAHGSASRIRRTSPGVTLCSRATAIAVKDADGNARSTKRDSPHITSRRTRRILIFGLTWRMASRSAASVIWPFTDGHLGRRL